ncbi:MAG: hypothetical protein F4Z77_10755 [Dehalococcoidia bacterium]|nr:hypothetical protein [Chloroflexota bacterium]MXW26754.1 hypothetical protein [Dehalococcoidia bacterium]MXZ87408.1 hypothetical protein [Dehalococcoidia bacterium]MYA52228.1 hypothetical protein [Dehalococcoidia bacterium]MYH68291.1 hypothetical protein [Dehalococcoidia bacterium]
MPHSPVFALLASALADLGYDEDGTIPSGAYLFVKYRATHAVVLPDDERLTVEDALDSLAEQGVDMAALLRAMEDLQDG